METALIKLVYKQVIDASASGSFEQNVLRATYDEFKLKSQTYNMEGKFKTFTGMKANDGRANSLHYKISFAAGNFIAGLKNKIPVLTDNLGNQLAFEEAAFQLIESDITTIAAHKLSISYLTETLTLCSIVGDYLILANGIITGDEVADTFVLKMQPGLSIIEFHLQKTRSSNNPVSMHHN